MSNEETAPPAEPESEPKIITVVMSDRPPLKIDLNKWPLVAGAEWFDSEHKCQANRERAIRVREHADGRRLVYGFFDSAWSTERMRQAGFLIAPSNRDATDGTKMPDEKETVRAIRRVAGIIGDDGLGDECIADLPAEELE